MMPPPRALWLPCGAPMLHYGGLAGLQLLVLQPLFEEMNRCRALVAALCRGLAARGVGCWMPDLPGTGEDLRPLEAVAWADWKDAVAEAAAHVAASTGAPPASLSIRGGALLDACCVRRWRLSPVDGASLIRDLQRAGLTGEENAGYALAPDLRAALGEATADPGGDARTLRLAGDQRRAERHVDGPALWRRSEPGFDAALIATLIDDVAGWVDARGGTAPAATPAAVEAERAIVDLPVGDGWIAATIDGPPDARRGWLFVTGGSQTRVGPNRLYERLARDLAGAGDAVIRYDRRGVGDSPDEDRGYTGQADEMAAAALGLRSARPRIDAITGFGLCDGATALALSGRAAGVERLVAANPWVVDPDGAGPPAAAIRAHYRERLRDPSAWWRLLRGGVPVGALFRSLRKGAARDDTNLAAAFAAGVPAGSTILLADGDNTARAFADAWRRLPRTPSVETIAVATRSHSFAGAAAQRAVADAVTRRR